MGLWFGIRGASPLIVEARGNGATYLRRDDAPSPFSLKSKEALSIEIGICPLFYASQFLSRFSHYGNGVKCLSHRPILPQNGAMSFAPQGERILPSGG